MWISRDEYDRLIVKTKGEDPKVKDAQDKLEASKKFHEIYVETKERELANLILDHKAELKRLNDSVDSKVIDKTKELAANNMALKISESNLKKETEILTQAFENLGFDVKDMKDILNKLVDGIVSKNQIQLVK